ncbi:hypothetical protein Vretimale_6106 [Volvox reticuliferus]|uniref:Uncharacterized protein n=1 Tax=Volvox reticuliferus TaxID=1737510 RepID=A0A8J4G744_9CHLO|nr:hypothetical protein Vretimale_6106 [Volvox reticuliferus]
MAALPAVTAPGRIDSLALQRRLASRGGGTDSNWRGLSVSLPYMPGGGVAVPGPSGPAAAEAASGLWLAQLELGLERPMGLPRVSAPGLSGGLFGGWAADGQVVPEPGSGAWRSDATEDWVAFTGHHRIAASAAAVVPRNPAVPPPPPLTTPAGERIKPLAEVLHGGGGGGTAGGSGPATAVHGSGSRAIAGTFADLWMEPELTALTAAEAEAEGGTEEAEEVRAGGAARRRAGGVLAALENEGVRGGDRRREQLRRLQRVTESWRRCWRQRRRGMAAARMLQQQRGGASTAARLLPASR